ncbi:hypothetical protein ACLKA6_006801 [Drosophila palustris]
MEDTEVMEDMDMVDMDMVDHIIMDTDMAGHIIMDTATGLSEKQTATEAAPPSFEFVDVLWRCHFWGRTTGRQDDRQAGCEARTRTRGTNRLLMAATSVTIISATTAAADVAAATEKVRTVASVNDNDDSLPPALLHLLLMHYAVGHSAR